MPLSFAQVKDVLTRLNVDLREEGLDVALGGGFAMQVHGSNRLTKDVDLIVESVPSFVKGGKRLGIGGVSTVVDEVPVDFIVRKDEYNDLYEAALRAAKRTPKSPVRVVTPSYLVAMKMVAGRPKDEDDLHYLLSSGKVKMPVLQQVITKYLGRFAWTEAQNLAEIAEWLKKTNRL